MGYWNTLLYTHSFFFFSLRYNQQSRRNCTSIDDEGGEESDWFIRCNRWLNVNPPYETSAAPTKRYVYTRRCFYFFRLFYFSHSLSLSIETIFYSGSCHIYKMRLRIFPFHPPPPSFSLRHWIRPTDSVVRSASLSLLHIKRQGDV